MPWALGQGRGGHGLVLDRAALCWLATDVGEGQKGTFREGKSRGGRKELVVLPLMLLALNKRLLVLQLPVL